jgi:hypothetical protein
MMVPSSLSVSLDLVGTKWLVGQHGLLEFFADVPHERRAELRSVSKGLQAKDPAKEAPASVRMCSPPWSGCAVGWTVVVGSVVCMRDFLVHDVSGNP